MNMNGGMAAFSSLPDDVVVEKIWPFLPLHDRWRSLRSVSNQWRQLTEISPHMERQLDLTWCVGDNELAQSATCILSGSPWIAASRIDSVKFYGPKVDASVLKLCSSSTVLSTQLLRVALESKQVSNSSMQVLAECFQLRELQLHCTKLTDATLEVIARRCCRLRDVDIAGCSRVSDDGVMAMAHHAMHLERLNVSACHRVSDRSVLALANRPSQTLVAVNVNKCLRISGASLAILLQSQTNLQTLGCAHCPKALDTSFLETTVLLLRSRSTQNGANVACNLEELNASGCLTRGAKVDETLQHLIASHGSVLTALNVGGLEPMDLAAFESIAQCANLRRLNLAMCRTLTDANVESIAAACKQMQVLELPGCVRLGDGALAAIGQSMKELKHINLEFCYGITDDGFCALVTGCERLTAVNVRACNHLSRRSFYHLVQVKKSTAPLKELHIGACANLDTIAAYVQLIQDKFPRCSIRWT